jgi:hypothetical protein
MKLAALLPYELFLNVDAGLHLRSHCIINQTDLLPSGQNGVRSGDEGALVLICALTMRSCAREEKFKVKITLYVVH